MMSLRPYSPELLLVGAPHESIGRVRSAWSNVPASAPPRKRVSVPAIGFGGMAALLGAIVGLMLVGPPGLGLALVAGGAGFFLGNRLANAPTEKTSYFIGEGGLQKNVIVNAAIESSIARLDDHWILYDRTHRTLERGGRSYDLGTFTRVELVPKTATPGRAPVRVPEPVGAALCDAAVHLHFAHVGSGQRTFPIFDVPTERGPGWHAREKGQIVVSGSVIAFSSGQRTERVPTAAVSASIRAGLLRFEWQGDRAEVPVREIGDSPVLIELLRQLKVLRERTE